MSKRQRKRKTQPIRLGELAPKELCQHNKIILEVVDRDPDGRAYIKRQRVLDECRLDSYLHRLFIDEREHEAGMKFRYAYVRVNFHIRVDDAAPNLFLNEVGGGNSEERMIAGIASEELLRKIYKILTPSQRRVVIAVCGCDEFAGTTAKRKTLKRALYRMARYWHLI
ncbi:MAG: hypothetical protein PHX43_09205 [Alphaproteobacteria bacterium]|nr:hypothetical protein [Alphaproteobacteria bacterium]